MSFLCAHCIEDKSAVGMGLVHPVGWAVVLLIAVLLYVGVQTGAQSPFTREEARQLLFHGPTPTVDAAFPYYQNRTPESIAEEIALRGYRAVHMVITSEKNVNEALLHAFHNEGIAVWGMVWAGGTYSTAGFPPQWQQWRQQLITPAAPDGFIYLSPYHPDYREWKKQALYDLAATYPFDGIELVEAFFPNWNGLSSGVYGDIGPHAQAAFKEQYGIDAPNFTDPQHPRYYKKVPYVYDQWIQFRVDTVTEWLDYLVNSPGGIRDARPDIFVGTWTLATDAPRAMEKTREEQGEDIAAVLTTVKPDIHFFQTNWPDWLRADLPPDYVKRYAPYVAAARDALPDLPLGVQADIGSQVQNRRDWAWIEQFNEAAWETGFQTHTMYEHHIALYQYTEKPRIMKVTREDANTVLLSFNKRVAWLSARDPEQYTIHVPDQPDRSVTVSRVTNDGNRLRLFLTDAADADTMEMTVTGVRDLPLLHLLKGHPELEMEPQTVTIPALAP